MASDEPTNKLGLQAIVRNLSEQKVGYYTYETQEEKTLRVTIKEIVESIPAEEIKRELKELGFHADVTYRMLSRRLNNKGRKTLNRNIGVNVPKNDKYIFNLRYLSKLEIKIENFWSDEISQGSATIAKCMVTLATRAM